MNSLLIWLWHLVPFFFRGVRFPWGDTIRVQRGSNSRWGSSRHFVFYLCWGFLAKWDSVCLIVPIYIYVLDPEEVERSIPLSQVIDWIILSESHMLGRRRLWVNLFYLYYTQSLWPVKNCDWLVNWKVSRFWVLYINLSFSGSGFIWFLGELGVWCNIGFVYLSKREALMFILMDMGFLP